MAAGIILAALFAGFAFAIFLIVFAFHPE